jgi:peptide/nickel transport system substrate-binding protein
VPDLTRRGLLTGTAGVVGVAAIEAGLGACTSSSTKTTSTPIPKASLNAVNPVDRTSLKKGGTLTLPMTQWSSVWNVLTSSTGWDADTATVMTALLPSLFHFKADGSAKYNPDFLAGEPVESVVGGKQTVTYKLNPKAKWSDGTSITYKDYVAQWKALSGTTAAYSPASTTGYQNVAKVVRGADDYEFVITFATTFTDWKSLYTHAATVPLYPASTTATPTAFNSVWTNAIPLTAAPFKVGSLNQTDKTVTLVRDPAWWGDPAILDTVVFKTISNVAQPSAFANGEVDSFVVGPTPSAYKTAKKVANAVILVVGGPDFRHLTINGTSPFLKDVNVRQAVAKALNRTVIAKSDLAGLPWTPTVLDNHFFMLNQAGYKDNSGTVGVYDPTAAGKLLDAAGWTLSGTYRQKGGQTLALNLSIPTDVTVATNEATLIQQMLTAVGIKLTIVSVATDKFFSTLASGKYDLTVFSWLGTPFPISQSYSIYQQVTPSSMYENYSHIGSPAIDAAMTKALADTDPAAAVADVNAADELIWQEANVITFYQRPQIVAQKKTLANYGAFGFQDRTWQDVGYTA